MADSIRLPPVDPAIATSLAEIQQTIARLALPPLLERRFVRVAPDVHVGERDVTLRVMQFNLLAEGLSAAPNCVPPFPATEASSYGGFTDVPRPEIVFDYNVRKWRLIEDILRTDPDILGVEECDHYPDFFEPVLRAAGYDSVYQPKHHSPCLSFGFYTDGVALFWKRDKFVSVSASGFSHGATPTPDGTSVRVPHVVAVLRSRDQRIERSVSFVVGATHLKAKIGLPNEELRAQQICAVEAALAAARATCLASNSDCTSHSSSSTVVTLLCADFNSFAYDHEGPAPYAALAVPYMATPPRSYRSLYSLPSSARDPIYSTWKVRGANEVRALIDYIWLRVDQRHEPHDQNCQASVHVECLELLSLPTADELEPARLPGLRHPSDHLPLAATLLLRPLE